jgi:hypothetical protein
MAATSPAAPVAPAVMCKPAVEDRTPFGFGVLARLWDVLVGGAEHDRDGADVGEDADRAPGGPLGEDVVDRDWRDLLGERACRVDGGAQE